ncbi:MAG: multiple monosaccharide ABC transporter permease [Beijerinckiaceae bacterium]
MSVQTTAGTAEPARSTLAYLRSNIRDYGMLLALMAIMIFFGIATDGTLFKPVNLTNVISQNSYIIIMALGMLLIIVAGHIDLSIGSVCAFVGGLAAVMMVQWNWHPAIAIPLCLVVGGLIGAAQGYFVAYQKIPSFIVTLAGMLVFRGLTLWLLQGQSVGPLPPGVIEMGAGFIPDVTGTKGFHVTSMALGVMIAVLVIGLNIRQRANEQAHGMEDEPQIVFVIKNLIAFCGIIALTYLLATYKGILNVLVIMGVLIALYSFIAGRTTVGRRIYALGGNEKATKLSGVNTERLTFLAFVNMGVLAALAGIIFAARLSTATPKAGVSFELDVIAACFIGGASAYGGVGTIIGAVIGAFIMGIMNNGMSILGIGIDWQQVIKGLVLLAAVQFDVYNKRRA